MTGCRIPHLASVVAAVLLAGPVAAGDRATVRGRVVSTDRPTHRITVQTVGGDDLVLTTDGLSHLSVDGKKVSAVDAFRQGRRVRATFEKGAASNRVIALRTIAAPDAALSQEVQEALKTARGYSFAQKEKYEESLREVVDTVDDRIDELQARAKDAGAEAKVKLDKQIDDLKRKRDEFQKRLGRARPAAEDAWEDVKTGVAEAAEDLGKAMDRFRSPSK